MPSKPTGKAVEEWSSNSTLELTFEQASEGAAVILGRTLVDKAELIDVPHIITSVSFRPEGKGGPEARDFVSVEAVDKDNRAIVYNDASTGVRRQIVAYLQSRELLPAGDPDARVTAPGQPESDTFHLYKDGMQLQAPRGLRRSDYTTPEFGEATTFYLA